MSQNASPKIFATDTIEYAFNHKPFPNICTKQYLKHFALTNKTIIYAISIWTKNNFQNCYQSIVLESEYFFFKTLISDINKTLMLLWMYPYMYIFKNMLWKFPQSSMDEITRAKLFHCYRVWSINLSQTYPLTRTCVFIESFILISFLFSMLILFINC